MDPLEQLSERFRRFAEMECKHSSLLYEHLARNVADDSELLKLAAHSRTGQPVPNLFLGAVHYLLLKGTRHELAYYYASIVQDPKNLAGVYASFKQFCKQYEADIIYLLRTRLVQTNEVRRCAYLYPAFCYIYQLTGKPLSLVEIGTSAGLQLLWDKYKYSYSSQLEEYGNEHAALKITSELRGDPILLTQSPPVAGKIGVDLHINDLKHQDHFLWLKALIWPEHRERRAYFEAAAACLEQYPVKLIEGDGVELLPDIVPAIASDTTLCIFHTHVANQFTAATKTKLLESIEVLGRQRDVFHLYNNMWDMNFHLDYYRNGEEKKLTLAETDGHGRWFKWKV
ncbi:DUF2332 domain-containing protein [Paenibacillus glycanilyticus]|uniref:DUF2332 domain-containing protein n=1 Tax=Paenibacillus glycanilyticus TaxID=126569 RepID=UPI0019111665|nr:DUF2332 domain-containing protein [Paenibacillus glycanilyticus]